MVYNTNEFNNRIKLENEKYINKRMNERFTGRNIDICSRCYKNLITNKVAGIIKGELVCQNCLTDWQNQKVNSKIEVKNV